MLELRSVEVTNQSNCLWSMKNRPDFRENISQFTNLMIHFTYVGL